MLRDVFPCLLKEGQTIESPTIWEISRLCVLAMDGQPKRARGRVNYALFELLVGIGEVVILAGLTHIVSVFDARMFRVLKAAGCPPHIIGTPRRIGETMSYAGLFNANDALQHSLRARLQIGRPVLAPGAKELAFQ